MLAKLTVTSLLGQTWYEVVGKGGERGGEGRGGEGSGGVGVSEE